VLLVLIGYMFLFIHRPFEIWPALGEIHLERLYMLGALFGLVVYSGKKWLPNGQNLAFFAFAAAVLLCWLASPWAALGEETVENYFKLLVFYVLIVLVVHDEPTLRRLVLGFLAVMFLYMTHSLREYLGGRHTFRMGIPRMIGVDLTLGDPNSFGASIVYALPFIVPFWRTQPSARLRVFLAAYVALSLACVGLTGSRSSFIGLLLWFLVVIAKSRWRWRLGILALLAAPILWATLPASLQTRFETIIHPEVGPLNAQVSGEGRLEGLQIGFQLWSQFPATGCGPGVWRPATGRLIESHNLYGQLVGEMGGLGLLTFGAILACFWVNLRWVRRVYKQHPEWGHDFLFHFSSAVGWGVFLLLFEGNFGHNLFRFSWLWYGGFLVIARYCIQERLNAAALWAWPTGAARPAFGWPALIPVYARGTH
jgi:O-antigen ligase